MTAERAPVRVVLIDDHPIFLQGLQLLLKGAPEIDVVGTGETGTEAIRLVEDLAPEVLVIDLDLPDILGAEAVRRILASGSPVHVVALSAYSDPRFVAEVMDAGALSFLPKTQAPESLLEAIEKAARGEGSVPGSFVGPMLRGLQEREKTRERAREVRDRLSAREQDVLELLAKGMTVSEAAGRLHVSVYTLRGHVRNILAKLDVHSMAQAVAVAYTSGFVASTDPPGSPAT